MMQVAVAENIGPEEINTKGKEFQNFQNYETLKRLNIEDKRLLAVDGL